MSVHTKSSLLHCTYSPSEFPANKVMITDCKDIAQVNRPKKNTVNPTTVQ